MKSFKISAIPGTLGQLGDRFMAGGYKDGEGADFETIIKELADLQLIEALELCYSGEGLESDAGKVSDLMKKYGYDVSFVFPALHCQRKWQNGTLSCADKQTRKQAIDLCIKTIDFAEQIGAAGVSLWLGQDGHDYALQTDYKKQWENLTSALKELADYKPHMKIAVEPKLREPRNRSLVDTTSSALLMCLEADRDNLGITIDVGHVYQAGMNVSQNIEIAAKYDKIFNFHVNDNYGTWDDDMMLGSVRFVENIEMFYTLQKIGYDKYLSVDIFPFRDNGIAATRESILYMKKYNEIVNKIGFDELKELIEQNDFTEVLRVLREEVFSF